MSDLLAKELKAQGITDKEVIEALSNAKPLPKREPIEIVKGNVLNAPEHLIVHQVNCFGVMGSGVAAAIKEWYPEVFEVYFNSVEGYRYRYNKQKEKVIDLNQLKLQLGQCQIIEVNGDKNPNTKAIVNIFSQYTYGTKKVQTLPNMLRAGLQTLREEIEVYSPEYKSIAFPYLIGCGLAGGDIASIDCIIREVFYDSDITIKYYDIN